jgi:hypothetical protein
VWGVEGVRCGCKGEPREEKRGALMGEWREREREREKTEERESYASRQQKKGVTTVYFSLPPRGVKEKAPFHSDSCVSTHGADGKGEEEQTGTRERHPGGGRMMQERERIATTYRTGGESEGW